MLNFFAEYHGKSILDGHFGFLSRCQQTIELNTQIINLSHLIKCLKLESEKEINYENQGNSIDFLIYNRNKSEKYLLNIPKIRNYLSFYCENNKLYAAPIVSFHHFFDEDTLYEGFEININIVKDTREIKRLFNTKI